MDLENVIEGYGECENPEYLYIYIRNNANSLCYYSIKEKRFGVFHYDDSKLTRNSVFGNVKFSNNKFQLYRIRYQSTNNNNVYITNLGDYRITSIFNQNNQTTQYVVDKIDSGEENNQFNKYIEQEDPSFYNKVFDVTFNNNGTIKQIDTKVNINRFQEIINEILKNRLLISNKVNIGLSNNTIIPVIMANNQQLFDNQQSNIRLLNSAEENNQKFYNDTEESNIRNSDVVNTYFTRLAANTTITEENQFQQFKNDFCLNDCKKDFAIIPFECHGHISTIIVNLENNGQKLSERLYLFDTGLVHANNPLDPKCENESNLQRYFNGLIKQKNVFCAEYKLQTIGNCAWLTSVFVTKCSELQNFKEVKQQIDNGKLLVDTINKTSELMQENLEKLLIYHYNNSITLHKDFSKSMSVRISSFVGEIRLKKINITNDSIKEPLIGEFIINEPVYATTEDGRIDYSIPPIKPMQLVQKKITQTELFIKLQSEYIDYLSKSSQQSNEIHNRETLEGERTCKDFSNNIFQSQPTEPKNQNIINQPPHISQSVDHQIPNTNQSQLDKINGCISEMEKSPIKNLKTP